MACGRCNKKKFENQQSSRMPINPNNAIENVPRKNGVKIESNMTPDQRRVAMNKVSNAGKFHKSQSLAEYQNNIQKALEKLKNRKK
jgi:hypothetical protein